MPAYRQQSAAGALTRGETATEVTEPGDRAVRGDEGNPLRCLMPLHYGAYAVLLFALLDLLEEQLCKLAAANGTACPTIGPSWLPWAVIAVVVASGLVCVYWFWRDFQQRLEDDPGRNGPQLRER